MKSFKHHITEARKSLVKGWTLKNKIVSVTSDYGNYHIMQVTNKPSKFGLNDKKLLKILEDWYEDMSAPNHEREAGIMLRKLKDGREIDNSPPIEEYLFKKGYCRFVIDKTHGSVEGQTEKECRDGAKILDDNYLPYERSGFKLFEIKPVRGRPKYITSKYDWNDWVEGKKTGSKRSEIGSTMARFRESYINEMALMDLINKHDDPLSFLAAAMDALLSGKLKLKTRGVANSRELVHAWNRVKKRKIKLKEAEEFLKKFDI
jgi:hypothetical protein